MVNGRKVGAFEECTNVFGSVSRSAQCCIFGMDNAAACSYLPSFPRVSSHQVDLVLFDVGAKVDEPILAVASFYGPSHASAFKAKF